MPTKYSLAGKFLMGNGFQLLDIILFAMIAAFLVFRLRSVLGRRTGHQRRPPSKLADTSKEAPSEDQNLELPDRSDDSSSVVLDEAKADDPIATGLLKIKEADPRFSASNFLEGARGAFEIIVKAYSDGDEKTLQTLLNDEVLVKFSALILERKTASQILETAIIGIKSVEIIDARIDGRTAFVGVEIISEQINVLRNKVGVAIEGDDNQITEVTDLWTFARNVRARTPNWILVETRSPD